MMVISLLSDDICTDCDWPGLAWLPGGSVCWLFATSWVMTESLCSWYASCLPDLACPLDLGPPGPPAQPSIGQHRRQWRPVGRSQAPDFCIGEEPGADGRGEVIWWDWTRWKPARKSCARTPHIFFSHFGFTWRPLEKYITHSPQIYRDQFAQIKPIKGYCYISRWSQTTFISSYWLLTRSLLSTLQL